MNTDRPIVLLVWLCALAGAQGQGTFTITFDGPPPQPPGTAYLVTNYSEDEMLFTPIGPLGPGSYGFGRSGGGWPSSPENGTAYLQAGLGSTLSFRTTGGSPFTLAAVDLAEYSTVFPTPVTVHFVGFRPDGTTVTADFTTDGIIDGTGPLPDFQTFYFGAEFSGLTRVEIPYPGWSLDNLVVSVPEPSARALLLLVGTVLAARANSRSARSRRSRA